MPLPTAHHQTIKPLNHQTIKQPPIISRIAPTPSGYLHKGNAFNFLLTWALIKSQGGSLWLRIDDIDFGRKRAEYVEDIFRSLEWLGISWDHGPSSPDDFEIKWSQKHRLDRYHEALQSLRDQEQLFACRCSRKQIRTRTQEPYDGYCLLHPSANSSKKTALRWKQQEGIGGEKFPILQKKDGYPAYQVVSVVDDSDFGINTVVRGQDLWPSTLLQQKLADILYPNAAFPVKTWLHHSLIMDQNHQKLSKSAGSISLQYLRQQADGREKLLTGFCSWMGWPQKSHHLDEMPQLLAEFGLESVLETGSVSGNPT